MWGSLIVFLLFIALITFWDARRIRDNETASKKDLRVYLGLMAVVAAFGVMSISGIRVPSPLEPLEAVFTPLGKWMVGE